MLHPHSIFHPKVLYTQFSATDALFVDLQNYSTDIYYTDKSNNRKTKDQLR